MKPNPHLLLTVLIFVFSFLILSQYKTKPSEVELEIEALVPKTDVFQVYYLEEGMLYFDDNQSVIAKIKGNTEFQKLSFNLPTKYPIYKIKIDIGDSVQKSIEIRTVSFKNQNQKIKANIKNDFIPNNHIKWQNNKIIPFEMANDYDPYFTSSLDVAKIIDELSNSQRILGLDTIFLIAFIFSTFALLLSYFEIITPKLPVPTLYTLIFILILITPLIISYTNINIRSKIDEKRELATKPILNLSVDYPQEFEKYFNDNFGLRTLLVNLNSRIKIEYFKVSPNPTSVLFGKNGFLFYNSKEDNIFYSYSHSKLAQTNNLEKAYQKQRYIKETLASKNIQYYAGFFPNKHTIYREFLPFNMQIQVKNDTSLADQLVLYCKSRNFNFIDVRYDLLTNKNKFQLYFKFDTHWNSYGAYLGYNSLCNQTYKELSLIPYDTSNFTINYSPSNSGDLTHMMGIDEIRSYSDTIPSFSLKSDQIGFQTIKAEGYPENAVVTLNENCKNKKTVFVFRDSYTSALIQFLSLHFYKVVYIKNLTVDLALIEKQKPDIVFSFCVERNIPNLFDWEI